jgi:hypothetical protein
VPAAQHKARQRQKSLVGQIDTRVQSANCNCGREAVPEPSCLCFSGTVIAPVRMFVL